MPYHVIQNFSKGKNVTRPSYVSPPGSVQELVNGHVTRGGDIEKRKAFVAKYLLPANTFSLASVGGALYTFGSVVAPAMPAGVLYQRLQNGAKVMSDVLSAEAFNGKLYVVVLWTDTTISHFYDGVLVAAWFDGRARATFTVNGGAVAGDTFTSVKVNLVEVLGSTVVWAISDANTANLIANAINSYSSSPEYTASVSGATVYVEAAAIVGATPNGYPVAVTVTLAASVTTPTVMAGGVAPGTTFTPGRTVKTFKSKLYSTSFANLFACAIDTPTDWTTTSNGAWFVNLSNYASGAQALVATAKYYDQLAIFSNDTTLLWDVESDPLNNKQTQEIPDIGTMGGRATATQRDGSVAFLSDQGVKALQARDASNFAKVVDISLAIDPALISDILSATATEKAGALVLVEPEDGRLWVVLGGSVYVRSFFPAAEIDAWSEYTPGFTITATAVNARRLYCRSGLNIYLFGGDTNAVYDTSIFEVVLPYVTLEAPATFKNWHAVDIGVQGMWDIYVRPEPEDATGEELVATGYSGLSYDKPTIPVAANTTHASLRLRQDDAEYAVLSSVALHYRLDTARG